MKHQRSGIAVAVVAAGLLVGCGGDAGQAPAAPTTGPSAATAPGGTADTNVPAPAPGSLAGVTDAVAALRTAAAAVPNGQPFDLERDTEGGQQIWEVKVASNGQQFDLDVSGDGARVLSQQQDQTPDDDVQRLQSARLSAVQAAEAAAAHQAGVLSEMEIDSTDDGRVIWQVDLRQPDGGVVEVNLDAGSGEILTGPR